MLAAYRRLPASIALVMMGGALAACGIPTSPVATGGAGGEAGAANGGTGAASSGKGGLGDESQGGGTAGDDGTSGTHHGQGGSAPGSQDGGAAGEGGAPSAAGRSGDGGTGTGAVGNGGTGNSGATGQGGDAGHDVGQGGQSGDDSAGAGGEIVTGGSGGQGASAGATGTGGMGAGGTADTAGAGGHAGTLNAGAGGNSGAAGSAGLAGNGGSGGTGPEECGAIPEGDCACVKVAPDGNDAAALEDDGATSFASIAVAIEFASDHRPPGSSVCVAAGSACGETGTYFESFWVSAPLGIYGGYESSGWTRCANSETRLETENVHHVSLNSDYAVGPVIIDGFTLTGHGFTQERRDVVLSNLEYFGTGPFLSDSGKFTLLDSKLDMESDIGILIDHPSESRLENVTLRVQNLAGDAVGVRFMDADGASLLDSDVSVRASGSAIGLDIGYLRDVEVSNTSIAAEGTHNSQGIRVVSSCELAVTASTVTAMGWAAVAVNVASAYPECSADEIRFESNLIHASTNGHSSVTSSVSSCGLSSFASIRIAHNEITTSSRSKPPVTVTSSGVTCVECELFGNRVSALRGPLPCGSEDGCVYVGTGVEVSAGSVDSNVIDGGCGTVGLRHGNGGTIQNNFIWGSACPTPRSSVGLELVGSFGMPLTIVNYNTITGTDAVKMLSGDAALSNNILRASRYGVVLPRSMGNFSSLSGNDFDPDLGIDAYLYFPGGPPITELEDMEPWIGSSQNVALSAGFVAPPWNLRLRADSPVRDRGWHGLAYDFDGDPRDATPDLGADEFNGEDHSCGGGNCSGLGFCVSTPNGDRCVCNPGSRHPEADPLRCEPDPCAVDNGGCDSQSSCTSTGTGPVCGACPPGYAGSGAEGCTDIDECATNNGGCDALTLCTDYVGARTCGPCPFGWSGSGDTDCVEIDECATNNGGCDALTLCTNLEGSRSCGPCPDGYSGSGATGCLPNCATNPCQNGATCVDAGGGFTCQCPPGIAGELCQITFTQLSAASSHSCGVRSDGVLNCWGWAGYYWGTAPAPTGAYRAVAAGSQHTCAIRSDGTLECWGENNYGAATPPSGTFAALASGYGSHTCAIRDDQTVACWGFDGAGQATPPSGTFTRVAVGVWQSCGIRTDGTLACWGDSTGGVLNPPLGVFSEVAVGRHYACALDGDGIAVCWGEVSYPPPSAALTALSIADDFVAHQCGILATGGLTCWGNDANGELVPPAGSFDSLSLGGLHACGTRTDGSAACWGRSQGEIPTGGL